MTARRTEPEGSVRWDQGPGEFAGVGDRAPLGTTGGNVFEPVAVRGCLIAGATREISLRVSRAVQTPRLGSQQIAVLPYAVRVDQFYTMGPAVSAYHLARFAEFGTYIPPSTSIIMERCFTARTNIHLVDRRRSRPGL
jgi:hypothetical protein